MHREFEAQAAEEVRLGLPVTFSVDTSDHVMCARVELNFLVGAGRGVGGGQGSSVVFSRVWVVQLNFLVGAGGGVRTTQVSVVVACQGEAESSVVLAPDGEI